MDKNYKVERTVWIFVTIILVILMIELLAYFTCSKKDFVYLVSFAATITSIILSVLAIFITVVSGQSTDRLKDSMIALSTIPQQIKDSISQNKEDIQKTTEELKQSTTKNLDSQNENQKQIQAVFKHVEEHFSKEFKTYGETLARTQEAIQNFIGENKGHQKEVVDGILSDEIINNFVQTTSVLC